MEISCREWWRKNRNRCSTMINNLSSYLLFFGLLLFWSIYFLAFVLHKHLKVNGTSIGTFYLSSPVKVEQTYMKSCFAFMVEIQRFNSINFFKFVFPSATFSTNESCYTTFSVESNFFLFCYTMVRPYVPIQYIYIQICVRGSSHS